MSDNLSPDQRVMLLTEREREVLSALADGLLSKQVAYLLGMSPRTVETHRLNIVRKLGCVTTVRMLQIAFAAGMGEPL